MKLVFDSCSPGWGWCYKFPDIKCKNWTETLVYASIPWLPLIGLGWQPRWPMMRPTCIMKKNVRLSRASVLNTYVSRVVNIWAIACSVDYFNVTNEIQVCRLLQSMENEWIQGTSIKTFWKNEHSVGLKHEIGQEQGNVVGMGCVNIVTVHRAPWDCNKWAIHHTYIAAHWSKLVQDVM
jgi:hypothetical protein